MTAAGFELAGEPRRGNEHRFFSADFNYRSTFAGGPGLRPHIQLEMSFETPALVPEARPLRSIVSRVLGKESEIAAFPCINPVETGANKLSALAWRVCVRQRGAASDDPRIIRHAHDLAALEQRVSTAPGFVQVLRDSLTADTNRGGGRAPQDSRERLNRMLERLATDPLWAAEYDEFVQSVSFAPPERQISFQVALEAVRRLVAAEAA